MTLFTSAARPASSLLTFDPRKLLFSCSSFIAVALTLGVCFAASLPRPWWAMLTVYVTAQPMAGAFRPKVLYRLGGVMIGAVVTFAVVPNLQNSPELLVGSLAAWTGLCIYLAVLDRTPRAFLFQMAAFSSAVISFPYLDDPGAIFSTTVARVQEMTLGILSVTIVHAVLQPWSVTPLIRARAHSFLGHASRWTLDVLADRSRTLTHEHRRVLAADVTELGMIAIHLPFDQSGSGATRRQVHRLQERLSHLVPVATAAANRLALLRGIGPLDATVAALVDETMAWLQRPSEPVLATDESLVERCRQHSRDAGAQGSWPMLLTASLCDRMAEFIVILREAHLLAALLDQPHPADSPRSRLPRGSRRPPALSRDHGVAVLAGLATASAITIYCAVWILLAWPNGSATAAFAALITCSFATQDDPAPQLGRYLGATLSTFPLAALYLFVILPGIDGYAMLILMLAPALLWMGYLQADPAQTARALPMFSCFIVAMGFVDRFQGDFAVFLNTGLAQVAGIVTTIAVTRLFRSASLRWTVRRIIRRNWRDLARLANLHQPLAARSWTAHAVDRLGQIAARMALAIPGDRLHAADGLDDLRIGRNLIQLRQALAPADSVAAQAQQQVLREARAFYYRRWKKALPLSAPRRLLRAIDGALAASLQTLPEGRHRAVLALVGMRCNLYPQAASYVAPKTS
ncbi:MAG: FUSC family protein [Bradyrhizobium sp.]|uniref:FUSC family protein n=1 Tax=Bradyrhizobium sp. TaxID=376 RepID=UPI003D0F2B05